MRVVKWNESEPENTLSAEETFTFNRLNEMLASIYGNHDNDALEKYRRLNIAAENMLPVGPLDVSVPKYPSSPSSESFVLKNESGLRIRFLSRGKETTANFMMDGHAVVAHIDGDEYKKAKAIYQEGRNKILDNMNVISIKTRV